MKYNIGDIINTKFSIYDLEFEIRCVILSDADEDGNFEAQILKGDTLIPVLFLPKTTFSRSYLNAHGKKIGAIKFISLT